MTMSLALIPALSACLVCLMAVYVLLLKRQLNRTECRYAELIDSLSDEIQGISHGSMGVGRKVLSLESKIETLEGTIEEMQKNDPSKVSYTEASRLVELGAGVDDLMNSCGISRPEAELVLALTNKKNDQVPVLTPNH